MSFTSLNLKNKDLENLCKEFYLKSENIVRSTHPTQPNLANYIDHTLLKAEATREQIENLCKEAIQNKFKTVCIQPCHIKTASDLLKNSSVLPITVVGFPLGLNTTETKVFETKNAIANGAQEVDMVVNLNALKSRDYDTVLIDIQAVVAASGKVPVKVIVETAYLNSVEKICVAACVQLSGAAFIKTSTGFASKGAEIDDIVLFKNLLTDVQIKASGGIKNYDQAIAFIQAGADRIGTSSGVEIIQKTNSNKDY